MIEFKICLLNSKYTTTSGAKTGSKIVKKNNVLHHLALLGVLILCAITFQDMGDYVSPQHSISFIKR